MSEEKISAEVWERKDKLMARLGAIKAASLLYEGTHESSETMETAAQHFYDWLIQDQTFAGEANVRVDNNVGSSSTGGSSSGKRLELPVSTIEQAGWLEKIEKTYGYSKEQVYAVENKYPSNKDDATRIVKELKSKS